MYRVTEIHRIVGSCMMADNEKYFITKLLLFVKKNKKFVYKFKKCGILALWASSENPKILEI